MKKHMTDYLDEVCKSIKGRELRQTARSELAVHMSERYGELESEGLEADAAALETVKRMGDAQTLGRRITAANRSLRKTLIALGSLALFILSFLFTVLLSGEPVWYLDAASFMAVGGLSTAYGILCCGRSLNLRSFFKHVKTGALYAGGISTLIGFIAILQIMGGDLQYLGTAVATAIITLIYGLTLSAAARIAESRLPAPQEGAIRDLLE
jgi:hypothetical protein